MGRAAPELKQPRSARLSRCADELCAAPPHDCAHPSCPQRERPRKCHAPWNWLDPADTPDWAPRVPTGTRSQHTGRTPRGSQRDARCWHHRKLDLCRAGRAQHRPARPPPVANFYL